MDEPALVTLAAPIQPRASPAYAGRRAGGFQGATQDIHPSRSASSRRGGNSRLSSRSLRISFGMCSYAIRPLAQVWKTEDLCNVPIRAVQRAAERPPEPADIVTVLQFFAGFPTQRQGGCPVRSLPAEFSRAPQRAEDPMPQLAEVHGRR